MKNKKQRIPLFFAGALLLLIIISSSLAASIPVKKEFNVLLITVDTLRYDRLSVYCDKYARTPNIDRLASRSFVFNRAFTHNPCTLPAHTNIMTGTTALYHGISDNSGFHLDNRFMTLASYVR